MKRSKDERGRPPNGLPEYFRGKPTPLAPKQVNPELCHVLSVLLCVAGVRPCQVAQEAIQSVMRPWCRQGGCHALGVSLLFNFEANPGHGRKFHGDLWPSPDSQLGRQRHVVFVALFMIGSARHLLPIGNIGHDADCWSGLPSLSFRGPEGRKCSLANGCFCPAHLT